MVRGEGDAWRRIHHKYSLAVQTTALMYLTQVVSPGKVNNHGELFAKIEEWHPGASLRSPRRSSSFSTDSPTSSASWSLGTGCADGLVESGASAPSGRRRHSGDRKRAPMRGGGKPQHRCALPRHSRLGEGPVPSLWECHRRSLMREAQQVQDLMLAIEQGSGAAGRGTPTWTGTTPPCSETRMEVTEVKEFWTRPAPCVPWSA